MKACLLLLAFVSLAHAQSNDRAFNTQYRQIEEGEKVIYAQTFMTLKSPYKNMLVLLFPDGVTTTMAFREDIAITSGCNSGVCAGDLMIDINTAEYVKVEGVKTDETFITSNAQGLLTAPTKWLKLAHVSGCTRGRWAPVCVGTKVGEYEVVGIQPDNRVVLFSEAKGIMTNIATNSLGVVID